MKTSIRIFMICTLILSLGCSTVKTLDPNYEAYRQAILAQPALVKITWSADGQRMTSLEVNPQINIQQKQPDAPHPGWTFANSFIRAAGIVTAIWAGGQALEGVIEAGNGATSIANSYNQPGGNMSLGNMEIPTEITTTTTTETVTGSIPDVTEPLPTE
jgi:hypothetical protein